MARRNAADLWTGLLLVAVAAVAEWGAADLRVGTAVRMGPGYFPQLMGWIVLGFGAVLVGRGLLVEGTPPEPWALRPLALIPGAIGLFGYGLDRFGLVLSVLALVFVARFGGRDGRPLETAVLAAGLAAFCMLVFIELLGMTLPVWPWGG